jgi:rhamnose transport system permease protein
LRRREGSTRGPLPENFEPLGSLNGAIIAFGGVPPIIVTLGTLSIYRGLIFLYSGSKSTINASELPPGFRLLAKGTPLGAPNLILFAILVLVAKAAEDALAEAVPKLAA